MRNPQMIKKMDAEKSTKKINPKPYFVNYETPEELIDITYEALRQAKQTGKVKKGTNEVTKAIERGITKLVLIAEDVEPPEVVAHLPILCGERKITYIFVPSKAKIGSVLGLDVPTASACILEPGEASSVIDQIIENILKIKKV